MTNINLSEALPTIQNFAGRPPTGRTGQVNSSGTPSTLRPRMKNIGDFLGLRRTILVMLAGLFALGLGDEFWSRFMPKYLKPLGAGIGLVCVCGPVSDLLEAL